MIAGRIAKGGAGGLPETGELAAVEAIDRTGLIVTSEGAFVRILRVTPPNPLLMSATEREKTAGAFGRLVSQLRAEETLQFYIDARPVNLGELLAGCRREVQASAGPAPASGQPARDPLALARWRLYAAMEESLRLHADDQAAIEVSAYVVVPFLPRQSVARAALAWAQRRRLPTAPLERPLQAHRRAVREHLAHVDALRSELEAEGMPTGLLDGEEVVRLLWARFNPTKADKGRRAPSQAVELLGELDAPSDRDAARQAAIRLKEQIAQSSLDFSASHQHVVVDHDVEQTILVANTAGRTQMGWLHGAMLTRQPFTLSVFVHGLERRRERQRLKLAYRRLSHDQPRRRAARPGPRLRPLRTGARVPGAARRDGQRRDLEPVQGLDLPDDPGTRAGAEPRGAGRGGRLLCRVDRVRRRLQGGPRRVSPARAVGLEPAARPRHPRQGAQVPDRQRRRHAAAGRHEVRVADRDPVRVRRPRPHRRAAQPLRRGARQLHARDRRAAAARARR